jgi:uncharacterized protein YfaA (DUF2138 family)
MRRVSEGYITVCVQSERNNLALISNLEHLSSPGIPIIKLEKDGYNEIIFLSYKKRLIIYAYSLRS